MAERQDLFRYVVEEFAEDYREGEIGRREFLHRMVLLGGGPPGARVLLTSLGVTGVSAAELALAQQTQTQAQQPATRPLVDPSDPAIQVSEPKFQARGFEHFAYLARPAGGGPHPGVLVIHENRGLQPHIQDVARRAAKAGYIALAPDLMSKQGGTTKFADTAQISAYLAQAGGDEHIANLQEALKVLKATPGVLADRLGVTGFCFGGGLTWRLATEAPELKAAVPFYGPAPDTAAVPRIKAAVLGIYGGNDARINVGIPALEAALKAANVRHQIRIYEGANHAFHNDTGANYKKDAAEDAWARTLEWFKTYLV
ncbi:MAG: dienelactone hydrolase family protein [Meiothermus sp.]|nr:dienelactone hydrolase family protein [Meiothermus sp.]